MERPSIRGQCFFSHLGNIPRDFEIQIQILFHDLPFFIGEHRVEIAQEFLLHSPPTVSGNLPQRKICKCALGDSCTPVLMIYELSIIALNSNLIQFSRILNPKACPLHFYHLIPALLTDAANVLK